MLLLLLCRSFAAVVVLHLAWVRMFSHEGRVLRGVQLLQGGTLYSRGMVIGVPGAGPNRTKVFLPLIG